MYFSSISIFLQLQKRVQYPVQKLSQSSGTSGYLHKRSWRSKTHVLTLAQIDKREFRSSIVTHSLAAQHCIVEYNHSNLIASASS